MSLGIMGFGIVIAIAPMGADEALYRADGLASIGLGLLGGLVALIPYRRGERWAWIALWFYPVFWTIHLGAGLPPGQRPHPPGRLHRPLPARAAPARAGILPTKPNGCPLKDSSAGRREVPKPERYSPVTSH
ncbi:hypothetical protein [Sinomonas atrocyanea]|uniref:hypothetical protein n=1 Tax=Sinomonas atrocyanea TaxID=37927 RepID=UPI0027842279|nr:hypothetical protein [Sinomonas atrocyanea]MDQ0261489.1 hypothetical protein [Sinomonas atrocyanea]MDR6622787.1 hypothetical protein [Sinomonas atrocyanea]